MVTFSKVGMDQFITDPSLEMNGVGMRVNKDVVLGLRRPGGSNKEYKQALSRYSRPHRKQLKQDRMDQDVFRRECLVPTYAESIVAWWHGVKDEAGRDVELTPENARAYFEAFPLVFDDVFAFCNDVDNYLEGAATEVAMELGES